IKPLLARPYAAVLADAAVVERHGDRLKAALAAADIRSDMISVRPGEGSKSFESLERVCGALIDAGVERADPIVAFGGGVGGDLAGFAAAILRRGCRFIQIPTTLLAQVDSAVGGKTAINVRQGKNLIGAFHQPSLVLADLAVLDTLPDRDLASGYAEVVKYGLLGDAAFFEWLEEHGAAVLKRQRAALAHAVEVSCAAKAAIVAGDERETGRRALLNLGHTFGHALEAETGYSERLTHGEGVAVGMALAFRYAARIGMAGERDAERVEAHLARLGLPSRLRDVPGPALDADALVSHMRQDKKVVDGRLVLILPEAIGRARVVPDADETDIADFLRERLAS
ncbi:MAG: 3-dehydroquinate synthase, partial [Pseudomonadota bacterium]